MQGRMSLFANDLQCDHRSVRLVLEFLPPLGRHLFVFPPRMSCVGSIISPAALCEIVTVICGFSFSILIIRTLRTPFLARVFFIDGTNWVFVSSPAPISSSYIL